MTTFSWIFIGIVLFVILTIWNVPVIVETINEELENKEKNQEPQTKKTPDWTGYGRFRFILPDGSEVVTFKNNVTNELIFIGNENSEWRFWKFGYEGPVQSAKVTHEDNRHIMHYIGNVHNWYVMLQKGKENKALFLDVYATPDGVLHQKMTER